MQFANVHSFVDIPFFSELSKYKLEEAKLSDERKPLTGFVTLPLANNRAPALRLTDESFTYSFVPANEQSMQKRRGEFAVPGESSNLNTIEAFKDTDKIALLKAETARLAQLISNESVLENPTLSFKFLLLSFSDLKKYKFYYWFMFPALAWTSTVVASDRESNSQLDMLLSTLDTPICIIDLLEGGSGSELGYSVRSLSTLKEVSSDLKLALADFGTEADVFPWHSRNVAALLHYYGFKSAELYIYRANGSSKWIFIEVGTFSEAQWNEGEGSQGWERNAQNRLSPKMSDVSSLMNPSELANQAVDSNLKLMKWRAAPQIDLDSVSQSKCLSLGAGTSGSYIARGLMSWGVRDITFVDSGTISYSNPVRQPLYTHEDCVNHAPKAETAANASKTVFPGVKSTGHKLEIPMLGHPITSEDRQHAEYDKLVSLMKQADIVFLLMDSRESRWLPTVISQALRKTVINVALGLDSYVVMRHGVGHQLGCYFCNDVVAPSDSMSRQTLDQMCTVTRPGCAMIASGHAVELMATICQANERGAAPYLAPTVSGEIPHQLRGFSSTQEIAKVWGPAFPNCSACSAPVIEAWQSEGWEFVKRASSDESYITESSGLGTLQRQTEELELESDSETEMM